MKRKQLGLLAAAAAVFIVIAIISSRKQEFKAPAAVGKRLLPDLPVNDIAAMNVTMPAGTITLAKMDGIWVAPEKYNYPANFEKVKTVILKLSEAKISETRALSGNQKKKIAMVKPAPGAAASGDAGICVEVLDAGINKVASVLLGNEYMSRLEEASRYGGMAVGRYASTDGGDTVHIINETFSDLSGGIMAWLNDTILSVNCESITSITMVQPGEKELVLYRKDQDLTMDGLSEGGFFSAGEELDSARVTNIKFALSYLRFDDIADPALTDVQAGMDKPAIFRAATEKDEVYTVKIGGAVSGNSESRYVRAEAALLPVPAPEIEENTGTNGVPPTAEDAAKADRKSLEDKTREINDRISRWTYIVSKDKISNMLLTRADIVKKKEKKEEKKDDRN